MATGVRNITVRFGGNARGLSQATQAGASSLSRFAATARSTARVAGGALAAIGAGAAFKSFIDGARESAKEARLTAAVIKSTGAVAGVSADQVGNLAQAISNKTGADDEAIQSGQNLLLTFTNIRNVVGSGNNIFDRASKTITDMAAALNDGAVTSSGLKSASIQLGKALNDPVKGVTALSKVGVSFTSKQRDQIADMIKANNVLGAQKIILNELAREFGGAAEAAADPWSKLAQTLDNVREDIGTAMLPTVERVADVIRTRVIPAAQGFAGEAVDLAGKIRDKVLPVLQPTIDAVRQFGSTVAEHAGGLAAFGQAVATIAAPLVTVGYTVLPQVIGAVGQLVSGLAELGGYLREHQGLVTALSAVVAGLVAGFIAYQAVAYATAAAQAIASAATGGWTVAFWALNSAIAANPIGAAVALVVALGAAFVIAWKKSETFRDIVTGTWNAIVTGVGAAVKGLISFGAWWVDEYLAFFESILKGLGHIPKWLGGGAFDNAAAAIQGLRNDVAAGVDAINAEISRIQTDVQIHATLTFTQSLDPNIVGTRKAAENEAQADKAWQQAHAAAAAAASKAVSSVVARSVPAAVAPSASGLSTGGAAAKKKAKKTAQDILDAFLQGLSNRFPTVAARLQKFSDGIAKHLGHGLDKVVAQAEKTMAGLQKKLDVLAGSGKGSISAAAQALTDAKKASSDFAASLQDSLQGLGDFGTHGGATFEIIRDRLAQSLSNAKAFQTTMAALSKAGLSDTAVKQLIAAGPGVATETGKAILAAGKSGIAQLNALQAQLDAVAKKTATAEANQFYAAGVKQAQAVLDGLKSKDAQLKKQMRDAGNELVDAVLKGLNLKVTSSGLKKVSGKRAAGGPVAAGRSYLVGERGPEIFTPAAAGAITANGDGGALEVHIHATGPTLQDIVRVELRESNRRMKTAALAGARRTA